MIEMMRSKKLHERKEHHYLEDHFSGVHSHMSCQLLLNVSTVNVLLSCIQWKCPIFHVCLYVIPPPGRLTVRP